LLTMTAFHAAGLTNGRRPRICRVRLFVECELLHSEACRIGAIPVMH
jgi:hypothetical protein